MRESFVLHDNWESRGCQFFRFIRQSAGEKSIALGKQEINQRPAAARCLRIWKWSPASILGLPAKDITFTSGLSKAPKLKIKHTHTGGQ